MLKKLLVFLAIFSVLLTGCGKKEEPLPDDLQTIKSRDKLIVGVRDDTKPFGYRDKDGNLIGFDIELSKMIAEHLLGDPSKVDFVVVQADDRISKLADKRLIVVFGTTGEKSLRDIYPSAKIFAYKTYTEAFAALKRGEADAIVADDTVLLGYALDDKSVKLLSKRYSREPYAIAFRQGEDSKTLQMDINEYINYLLSTGKLKRLAERYNLL